MGFLNVRDNSKVFADGIHDDAVGIQECLDSLRGGGTIYFPDGVYLISSTLIFYSDQHLKLSDKAIIRRSDKVEPFTRYLLGSYSEPLWGAYSGTHNVVISGGTFDGNEAMAEKSTLLNTVHCKDIVIENCNFINCSTWHFIEINSTQNAVVRNCVFNGPTYTAVHGELLNEQVQLDLAREGSYGPVYNSYGDLIDFCKDDTACSDILIESNIFKCNGFPGIGHHGDGDHHNIVIKGNIFDGPSGNGSRSRGYIIFKPAVYNVNIENNVFIAPDETSTSHIVAVIENPIDGAFTESGNVFVGNIGEKFVNRVNL